MLTNLPQLRRAHSALLSRTKSEVKAELEQADKFTSQHVRQHPRGYRHRTGALADGVRARVLLAHGGRMTARVTNVAKHAPFIEWGTRPHEIRARRVRFLRFTVRGRVVYALRVRHPGTRPYKPLYLASFAFYRVLGPALEQRLDRVARRF